VLTEREYDFQSSNSDHWWAGPAELVTTNWESSSASALERMVSMTGYWNAEKSDILMHSHKAMAMAMAIAMGMLSSERMPPSMPPSQDEARTIIGDFTEITVSNSDNDLHILQVTIARLDGRMPDIPEVELWMTVLLWMFLLSLSLLFTSLLLWISARVFTTSGDISSGGGVSPCTGSAEWLPYGTNWLWDLWVRTIAYFERLCDCFLFYSCTGLCSPGGLHLQRGIM